MNKASKLSVLSAALSLTMFASVAMAEDSKPDGSTADRMPVEVKEWVNYLVNLEARYPDSAKVDAEAFVNTEGEYAATLYCRAMGFAGPCAPAGEDGSGGFVALKTGAGAGLATRGAEEWWRWLITHMFNISVIPETFQCPAPYTSIQMYMDDEDSNNNNGRGGWIGATVSNSNTTWRFCRIDLVNSLSFRPLPVAGNQYDYAVLRSGIFCPSGGRTVVRYEDNENWSNANSYSGDIFPNVNVLGRNWLTLTCHFDGAASSLLGHMPGFPNLGIKYGVFAPQSMPSPYALSHGWVYQDDQDTFNTNFWTGSPDWVMSGSSNTTRNTAKVQ